VGNKQEIPIVRWLYARPLAKDPVQAMLLICLQEQMEGNQLLSKANRTFVAHMGIWTDSAGQGERLKQCASKVCRPTRHWSTLLDVYPCHTGMCNEEIHGRQEAGALSHHEFRV